MPIELLEFLQQSEKIHWHIVLVDVILVYFADLLIDLNLADDY
jgi:hypothetical protein